MTEGVFFTERPLAPAYSKRGDTKGLFKSPLSVRGDKRRVEKLGVFDFFVYKDLRFFFLMYNYLICIFNNKQKYT